MVKIGMLIGVLALAGLDHTSSGVTTVVGGGADSADVAAVVCEAGTAYAAKDTARLAQLSAPDYVR